MKKITDIIKTEESVKSLAAAIDGGACPALCTGVGSVHAAHIIAALRQETERPGKSAPASEVQKAEPVRNQENVCRRL